MNMVHDFAIKYNILIASSGFQYLSCQYCCTKTNPSLAQG